MCQTTRRGKRQIERNFESRLPDPDVQKTPNRLAK